MKKQKRDIQLENVAEKNLKKYYMKKIIIIPIQEPWTSMIADGDKLFEFRGWWPKTWVLGQEMWFVATGKAKSPREIIAKGTYGGTFVVKTNYYDGNDFITPTDYKGMTKIKDNTLIGERDIWRMGGKSGDFAIKLNNIKRVEPFTLESIGIMRTPQKFQYHYEKKEEQNEK